ncbi:MAG: hypothetical protein Kow00124_29210 [Anaerolineae bacterium]
MPSPPLPDLRSAISPFQGAKDGIGRGVPSSPAKDGIGRGVPSPPAKDGIGRGVPSPPAKDGSGWEQAQLKQHAQHLGQDQQQGQPQHEPGLPGEPAGLRGGARCAA